MKKSDPMKKTILRRTRRAIYITQCAFFPEQKDAEDENNSSITILRAIFHLGLSV